jgi:hypothetical protein
MFSFPRGSCRCRINNPPKAMAKIGLSRRRRSQAVEGNVANETIRQRQADNQDRVSKPAVGLVGDA